MGLRVVRRSDAALRPRLRPRAQRTLVPGVGRRRRVQRRARDAEVLAEARRRRHRAAEERPRLARGGLHPPGRRGHVARHLARLRRPREEHARRSQLHREGLRHPPRARLLRPRPLGRVADQAGRGELGEAVRRGRGALVPHRRDLRRARDQHVGGGARGGGGGEEVRHRGGVRPELPRVAVEEPGRQGRRAEA